MYFNQSNQTEDGVITVLRKVEATKVRSHRHCINDETSWGRLATLTLNNMTCGNVPWLCQIVHYVQRRPLRRRASESSQGHREARSLLQCTTHPVTAVFLSHWISVQTFQYKRLLLLDTCSRYVHTNTAWHVQSVYPHKHVKPLHFLRSVFRCNVSDHETSISVPKCRYSVSNVAARRAAWWQNLQIAHGKSGLWEQNCCLSSADGGGWYYEQCRELRCWMGICERSVYSDWS